MAIIRKKRSGNVLRTFFYSIFKPKSGRSWRPEMRLPPGGILGVPSWVTNMWWSMEAWRENVNSSVISAF